MDFKKLRIAILATAILFVTNTLAAATQKTGSNTELLRVSETQQEKELTIGQMIQNNTLTEVQ